MSDFISKNICPITHTPVDEIYKTSTPVLAPDGWTYNKEALVKWLTSHGNSPVTRQPMTISQLIVNRALIPDTVPDSPTSSVIKFVLSAGLDNSASMGEEAEIVNSNGKRERHGLSQLDLAKHSLVCVVNSLDETSMFGLVVWSTSAEIVLPLTKMDKTGREKAVNIIKNVRTNGSTNLWDGIKKTQLVCDTPLPDCNPKRCAWILSDGQPNYEPPKSYREMMVEYDREHGDNRELRTIGYGFCSDSSLLSSIAGYSKKKGGFVFISDPGFVGTVIVHLLANSMNPTSVPEQPEERKKRMTFINCLQDILDKCAVSSGRYGRARLRDEQISQARTIYDEYLTRVGFDTIYQEPEISIALDDPDNWSKWGGHYVRSLLDSHKNRECINFKDPSVQQYQTTKSPDWTVLRDAAHDTYKNLPAPEPSVQHHYRGGSSSAPSTPRLQTLATYSQASNGCLHEDAKIKLADGRLIACKDVLPGAAVWCVTPDGTQQIDYIETIVRSRCRQTDFVRIPKTECDITPWHPVMIDKSFKFPANIAKSVVKDSEFVYSFVLFGRSSSMIIGDCACITLAHGLAIPVAKHDFWGTEKVVMALKNFASYNSGIVTIDSSNIVRGGDKNDVVSIFPHSNEVCWTRLARDIRINNRKVAREVIHVKLTENPPLCFESEFEFSGTKISKVVLGTKPLPTCTDPQKAEVWFQGNQQSLTYCVC
ncbi:MAG: VWA domain-containing protein [Candidatus Hodarchaeales archaeon]